MKNGYGCYNQVKNFDKNQKVRIAKILELQGICLAYHQIFGEFFKVQEGEKIASLFSVIINISDSLLLYQIFDEITASFENRANLESLLEEIEHNEICEILSQKSTNPDLELYFAFAISNFKENTLNQFRLIKQNSQEIMYTDFINGSLYQDFTVNTFSAFELFMEKIFNALFDKSDIFNNRKERIKKILSSEISDVESDILERLSEKILEEYNSYIPSNEKIQKIVKKVDVICKDNKDNVRFENVKPLNKREKAFISFYQAQRNSVHNLGIHSKSKSEVYYNVEIEQGKPSYFNNMNDNIEMSLDLLSIYIKIFNVLSSAELVNKSMFFLENYD